MIQPTVSVAQIDVPEGRARDFDPAWAEALARMIEVQGLLQPILVRPLDNGRYALVAGLHRLTAMDLHLGWKSIPVRISTAKTDEAARLEEVMENLGRYDLIALDRCHHLHELKALWLKLYPQAKAGGERVGAGRPKAGEIRIRIPDSDSDQPSVFGFADAVAEKVGLGRSQIAQAVRIWHYLSPESRRRLAGTDLARKQTELKALSEQKAPVQAKVLDLILGEAPPENVAQALEWLQHGRLPDTLEKRFAALSTSFGALKDPQLDALIVAHEDRVIASLKRRGRI